MKYIVYDYCSVQDDLKKDVPHLRKFLPYSKEAIAIAKEEAYNGKYTIEDDGQPDPAVAPSQLDIIEAQVTYTAMMTDTLLEV